MEDLRPAITYELGFQIKRGLIRLLKSNYNWQFTGEDVSFDQLAEAGVYFLGDPDSVAGQLKEFYDASGGFGTLLIVTGKDWATREKRARSMKLFMEHVAPKPAPGAATRGGHSCGLRLVSALPEGSYRAERRGSGLLIRQSSLFGGSVPLTRPGPGSIRL